MTPSVTISVALPASVAGGRPVDELEDEVRALAVALAWQRGDLSFGQAARVVGMDRVRFHDWLLAHQLPTTTYGEEDFRADLATIGTLGG